MELTVNLLITLLVEIPIIGFFFKRKKRKSAYLVCLFVNFVTWPIYHIIRLKTDINPDLAMIGAVILEGVGYWFFLNCNWKKATLLTLVANAASFILNKLVHIEPDLFHHKLNIIK
jgi:hypothetical protein